MNTPVLFIVFNRPKLTEQVLNQIRSAKPKQIFIAADGPRSSVLPDKELCAKTRALVLERIDWPCEMHTLFRDENLGCKKAVSNAINWFFEHVDEGIILEDDTLPNLSFFNYAERMLALYRSEKKVMHIAGAKFQQKKYGGKDGHYFSKYLFIWGWATWKRAWKHYDITAACWPVLQKSHRFSEWNFTVEEKNYWSDIFDKVYSGGIDTWDYQWMISMINNNGLMVVPDENMISNIGFGENATHTKFFDSRVAALPVRKWNYDPISAISPISINKKADEYILKSIYLQQSQNKAIAKQSLQGTLKKKLKPFFSFISKKAATG